jgi:2-haloacid dehalogenase
MGLQPGEALMVASHEGDLAAAQTAGLYTAHASVPEEDNVSEGFETPGDTHFDIVANDFDALCEKLKV